MMVVITTAQETANVIPALHFAAAEVLALDTDQAERSAWGGGSGAFLTSRGVRVTRAKIPDGPLPDVIAAIEASIRTTPGRITWSLGGGTKLHQFAVSQVLEARCRSGIADRAVYADPQRGVVTEITLGADGWRSEEQRTRTDIGVRGVLQTFRRNVVSLVTAPNSADTAELARFRTDPALRRGWFEDPAGVRPAFGAMLPFDRYLETLVLHLARAMVPSEVDVAANVIVGRAQTSDQEHDVLLADGRGRLLSIDAKAHVRGGGGSGVAKKDIGSRLLQIQHAGGVPARFVVAVPYHRADVNQPWYGKSRRFLPLNLELWGVEFCVIGEDDRDFWIRRSQQTIEFGWSPGPGWTQCRTLESVLRAWCA